MQYGIHHSAQVGCCLRAISRRSAWRSPRRSSSGTTTATPNTPDVVDPIFVPSGKVDVPRPFTIAGGEGVDLTLDFDASLSVQVNEAQGQQEFILRPVITPVSAVNR